MFEKEILQAYWGLIFTKNTTDRRFNITYHANYNKNLKVYYVYTNYVKYYKSVQNIEVCTENYFMQHCT